MVRVVATSAGLFSPSISIVFSVITNVPLGFSSAASSLTRLRMLAPTFTGLMKRTRRCRS